MVKIIYKRFQNQLPYHFYNCLNKVTISYTVFPLLIVPCVSGTFSSSGNQPCESCATGSYAVSFMDSQLVW